MGGIKCPKSTGANTARLKSPGGLTVGPCGERPANVRTMMARPRLTPGGQGAPPPTPPPRALHISGGVSHTDMIAPTDPPRVPKLTPRKIKKDERKGAKQETTRINGKN